MVARQCVVADVREAVTYVVVVEGAHDVAGVSVQFVVEINLSAYAHGVLQQVAIHTL